jgi:hypothetical protein
MQIMLMMPTSDVLEKHGKVADFESLINRETLTINFSLCCQFVLIEYGKTTTYKMGILVFS